ncbi:(-)-germacrene D synthase, partial [Mucuna pruriens]
MKRIVRAHMIENMVSLKLDTNNRRVHANRIEKVLIWATSDPIIVAASTIICRLMDDIVGDEFEQERTHVVSSIECYMKQHKTSRQYAIDELRKMKDINKVCLIPTQVPITFLIRVINFTRVIDVLYKAEDNYTNAGGILKDHIKALLVNKMSISIS